MVPVALSTYLISSNMISWAIEKLFKPMPCYGSMSTLATPWSVYYILVMQKYGYHDYTYSEN